MGQIGSEFIREDLRLSFLSAANLLLAVRRGKLESRQPIHDSPGSDLEFAKSFLTFLSLHEGTERS